MAITYHAGRRIQGSSTDVAALSFEENFSDDTWVSNGTKVAVTSGVMRVSALTTVDTDYKRVLMSTTLNDDNWIADFDFLPTSSSFQYGSIVSLGGLHFIKGNVDVDSDDSIGMIISLTTGNSFAVKARSISGGSTGADSGAIPLTTTTQYYIRLQREGTVGTLSVFDDIARTSHISSSPTTFTIDSGITSLNYAQIGDGIDGSGAGWLYTGDFDNIKIYNGVTSIEDSVFPANAQVGSRFEETDTRKMYHYNDTITFESDFSSDNWLDQDTKNVVNTGTELFDFDGRRDGTNDGSSVALGFTTSGDYVFRYIINFTTYTAGNGAIITVGLGSLPSSTIHTGTADYLGVRHQLEPTNKWLTQHVADGANMTTQDGHDTLSTYSTGTDYYVEQVFDTTANTFVVTYRTTSHTGTTVQTRSATATGTYSMAYVRVDNAVDNATGGTMVGTMRNFEVYDGVTTVPTRYAWSEEGT